jgi:hypothetical protein
MDCGVCVSHWPQEGIDPVRDPAKGAPLEYQKLIAHAAQLTKRQDIADQTDALAIGIPLSALG